MPEILPPADPALWVIPRGHLDTGWIDHAAALWLMTGCEVLASILALFALLTLLSLALHAIASNASSTSPSNPFHCPLGQIHR